MYDYTFTTPEGRLTQRDEGNDKTTWTVDYLIKRPEDMRLVKKYLPVPKMNKEIVRRCKREVGEAGEGGMRRAAAAKAAGSWIPPSPSMKSATSRS